MTMTTAEIIEEQRRICEADKKARAERRRPSPAAPNAPKQSGEKRDLTRLFMEDRIYDGKAPEGNIDSILRKENPDEYVARDGTRTFVPWRYVSMQDLELPDNGNPYRPPKNDDVRRSAPEPLDPYDPWARPSGYIGSAGGQEGIPEEYDPWKAAQMADPEMHPTADSWDSWLSSAPPAEPAEPRQESAEVGSDVMPAGNEGTLDLMRTMRR
jgi:hypothetical protein